MTRWHLYDSDTELAQRASAAICRIAAEAIATRGAFHLVLAGGNTPRAVHAMLAGIGGGWDRWHIYFGDDRCLPPDHPERNSRMAWDTLLSRVPIPTRQIHSIPAELGAEDAARSYTAILPAHPFDLTVLGLGEDGHTASLFPGHLWGEIAPSPSVLAVHDAPKPPPDRVSLSAARLSASRQVFFLVTGDKKREAVSAWRAGRPIPAAAVNPPGGVDAWVDQAAWPRNP